MTPLHVISLVLFGIAAWMIPTSIRAWWRGKLTHARLLERMASITGTLIMATAGWWVAYNSRAMVPLITLSTVLLGVGSLDLGGKGKPGIGSGGRRGRSTSSVTVHIDAPRHSVYRALINPALVAQWRGSSASNAIATVGANHGRFVKLVPGVRVVEAVDVGAASDAERREMTVTYTLTDAEDGGTTLHAEHDNLPPGVSAEDNELRWRMMLARLATCVEDRR